LECHVADGETGGHLVYNEPAVIVLFFRF